MMLSFDFGVFREYGGRGRRLFSEIQMVAYLAIGMIVGIALILLCVLTTFVCIKIFRKKRPNSILSGSGKPNSYGEEEEGEEE